MKPKNMSASVHARLLNLSKATRRPFNELLQYYGMERFLYRLSHSPYQDRFVLKGALVFVAWGAPQSRATKDIDLLGYGNNAPDALQEIVRDVCYQTVVDDGLIFDSETVSAAVIKEGAEYEGVRIKLIARLDNAVLRLQIDIGFGDSVIPSPTEIAYPTLLDLPAPMLRIYPRETIVAEKFHALVVLGELNSRMKDFYDLWLLMQFEFEFTLLQEAVRATFGRRGMAQPKEIPVGLTADFATMKSQQWQAFVRRSRLVDVGSLGDIVVHLQPFLAPFYQPVTDVERVWRDGQWRIKS